MKKNLNFTIVGVLSVFLLNGSIFAKENDKSGQDILVNGKYWRQLTDTLNISGDDFDIYNITTGRLKDPNQTMFNGVDFSGYTWASASEVEAMILSLPGANNITSLSLTYREKSSEWAPYFFDTLRFNPTTIDTISRGAVGTTRGSIKQIFDTSRTWGTTIFLYDTIREGGTDTVFSGTTKYLIKFNVIFDRTKII